MTAQEFKYTNFMTLEEWKEFKKEFEKQRSIYYPIKNHLEKYNSVSFDWLIGGAFTWNKTDKGHKYWLKISKRTKPVLK